MMLLHVHIQVRYLLGLNGEIVLLPQLNDHLNKETYHSYT